MGITYEDAGVSINRADRSIEALKGRLRGLNGPQVLGGIGGFGGLYDMSGEGLRQPVLVSGTDGVGTKLKLAFLANQHDTVGIDLVAMCVNDVIVCGAKPLFFLDYLATGRLEEGVFEDVLSGIIEGCRQGSMALLGGETAEMPGMYPEGEYDLAGFSVGVVEREAIVDGKRVEAGDAIIGLPSSGLHSNGFSLVRKVLLERRGLAVTDEVPGIDGPLGAALLTPTRIYVDAVAALQRAPEPLDLRAMCHVTGGGIVGNLPRVLPDGLGADMDTTTWTRPPVFDLIQGQAGPAGSGVDEAEMYRTFNMGLGYLVVVPQAQVERALARLAEAGEPAMQVGRVVTRENGEVQLG